jgi:hypothetical protein
LIGKRSWDGGIGSGKSGGVSRALCMMGVC